MKPWRRQQWCIPSVGAEFVWRMEDVLDLYAEEYDPQCPQVCFDEMPYQLIEEKRTPLPAKPGVPQRYDLRVPEERHAQPVRLLRAPRGVAPRGGERTAYQGRLR